MTSRLEDRPGEAADGGARERGGVQSLERGFALLERIAAEPDGISMAELSRSTGLHSSTAHHLVRTLLALGYVRQDEGSRRYVIGRKVFSLAATCRTDANLVGLAEPVLHDLSRTTGQSSHLAILSGDEVVIVTRVPGPGAFQMRDSGGGVRPGHATAIGKVLLAALDGKSLEAYLATHPLRALTERTITERERLLAELETVRRIGIAYDDAEYDPEVRCVAVPVRDFTGRTVAALGVSGPVWRLSLPALQKVTATVEEAAARLSAELGERPQPSPAIGRRNGQGSDFAGK